jgi:hypothetical protein
MFQALSQGAILPVLLKNEPRRVVEGKVISVNTHMPVYNPSQPMAMLNGPVTDISVQIDNDTIPFSGLPANGVVANFPDKGYFIATDKSLLLRELDSMESTSKQVLGQIPFHEKMVEDCARLKLELQPEKQKEIQQAQEIESLKTQLNAISGKFDQMVEMLSAKLGT